jgi:heptosyltransferase-2
VVLVQTAFVGDVVFASPLVHAIKQSHPQAWLAMVVRPGKAQVAACIPGVDEVVAFDKRSQESGPDGLWRTARRLRAGNFDLMISPHRSARTALLARLSGIPLRVGMDSWLGRLCYHQAVRPSRSEPSRLVQHMELLKRVGIPPAGYQLRLKAPEGQRQILEAFQRSHGLDPDVRMVALCIGSVWPTKRWPAVYFGSLAESLKERGYLPVLFGGGDEIDIARAVSEVVKGQLCDCVGNSLSESAALLEHCKMAVGGDTGLTHMARALGVPTVVIYGPTDSRQHMFTERTKVLAAKIKCRPCSRHGQNHCPEKHHDCMRLVSPEQVMDAFREIANLQTPVPPSDRADLARDVAGENLPLP